MKKVLFLAILAFAIVSCTEKKEENSEKRFVDPSTIKQEAPKFTPWTIEDSSKIITTPSGLQVYVVQEGPGPKPEVGKNVTVNYHGMLLNGKVFDSSFKRGKPFKFPLGVGRVIKGWDEGIAMLTFGTKAILIIPSDLGYGERGSPPNIPPNSTLVFHVQLLGSF